MCFALMMATLAEDERRFAEKLYDEYGDYMYAVALGVLKNRQDAEDAVSDAMCKILKYLEKFEKSGNETVCNMVVICIRSIVRNKAIDHYNKRKRRAAKQTDGYFKDEDSGEYVPLDFEDDGDTPEEALLRTESVEALQKALLMLPQEMQDAVNLVYFCGWSSAEAGDLLGISDTAVRARLFKARKKLKTILEEVFDIHGSQG